MSAVTHLSDHRQPAAPARLLPASVEAEQALLGAILMNNAALHAIGSRLEAEHFSEEIHRRIFEVASSLIKDGKAATPITVKTFLGDQELAPGMTVGQYIARLAHDATTVINAPTYAQMVADLYARRQIIAVAREIEDQAFDPPVSMPALSMVDGALEALRNIGDTIPSVEQSDTNIAVFDRLIEQAEENLAGKSIAVPSSGLTDMDRTLGGGLRSARLIVLAGRPGMGKSVLKTAIARRAAMKGHGVGDFNLEIDSSENMARLAANALAGGSHPMDYRDILTGRLDAGQIERLVAAREWIANLPLEVCDRSGLTMQQIETRAVAMRKRLAQRGRRLDVVLIDYLQLVKVTDRYKGNIVNEYGEVALAAKNMAKRLETCVVLLSQLSRGVEGRENKRPLLSDLRGSGNIEEHADAVGLLYRPGYYDKHDPKVLAGNTEACAAAEGRRNLLEVIWEKNRLGPTSTDSFFCDVARSQVDSHSRHQDQYQGSF